MQEHLNAKGKKACLLDPINKMVEVCRENFKVLIQFNADGTATVTNYDLNGQATVFNYSSKILTKS